MTELLVKVVKPFYETRTPCPSIGTIGEWWEVEGIYCKVRFPLPMKDMEGNIWLSHGESLDYMYLKFLSDEIELVDEESNRD